MEKLIIDYKDKLDYIGSQGYVLKMLLELVSEDLIRKMNNPTNQQESAVATYIYFEIFEMIESILTTAAYDAID